MATNLIMREYTATAVDGTLSSEIAAAAGVTLNSWAKFTRGSSCDSNGVVNERLATRPMVFVFQRGYEITLVSYDERALEQLLADAAPELQQKGIVLPPVDSPRWRSYDVIGRFSYEGEGWCKLAFRTAGESDPKRYFGVSDGWSLCGCEREDLGRVFPGLDKLYWAWYDTTKHHSMKGYWLEF